MYGQDFFFASLNVSKSEPSDCLFPIRGGLFLDHDQTACPSIVSLVSSGNCSCLPSTLRIEDRRLRGRRKGRRNGAGLFLSVSLSIKGSEEEGYVGESRGVLGQNGDEKKLEEKNLTVLPAEVEEEKKVPKERGSAAFNTTKHLWAGAVAAMVSRTFIAPLERLKLEYIVCGQQKSLFELMQRIAGTEGLKGFWKGNFVNILRTAPFKSINFYAYDTYRNRLLKWSGNEEATNFERFVAGAAAGITATLLCLPMDTGGREFKI